MGWATFGSARWAGAQANSIAGSGWQLDTAVILLALTLTHPLKPCGEKAPCAPPGLNPSLGPFQLSPMEVASGALALPAALHFACQVLVWFALLSSEILFYSRFQFLT